MSAKIVAGISHEVAEKLDTFWDTMPIEHKAALHTAYNFCNKRIPPGCRIHSFELLANAGSGRRSISNVRGDFLRFMERNIDTCNTAEAMLSAIIEWGKLDPDKQ